MTTTASLDAALSGMLENQRHMEMISNNLANVNTTGYKRVVVHFQDVLDSADILAALRGELPEGEVASTSTGVEISSIDRAWEQGPLRQGSSLTDLAILGEGLFRVTRDDGSVAYTRDGNLRLDNEGSLTTVDGFRLDPPVQLPAGARDPRITADGRVTVLAEDGSREEVGRIGLVRFPNPTGLDSIGQSLFVETAEAGAPIAGFPGEDGIGELVSGFLEASNVDLAGEMTSLVIASRAYQMNLSAYRTIEEMLQQANQLA
jgi:flagellar basal-body rod protein FlgG